MHIVKYLNQAIFVHRLFFRAVSSERPIQERELNKGARYNPHEAAPIDRTLRWVHAQYTQTRCSVGGCRLILCKNRLEFYSCDSVATTSRQRLHVL